MSKFNILDEQLKEKYRFYKLVPKDKSIFMKVIYICLLMFLWNKRFFTSYTTVIGCKVYMPATFIGSDIGALILRHEEKHMSDISKYHVWFVFSYLFLLPIGPSFRAYWEFRGYKESIRAIYETYGEVPDKYLEHISKNFTGSNYLWMWPFKKHTMKILRKIRDEIVGEV